MFATVRSSSAVNARQTVPIAGSGALTTHRQPWIAHARSCRRRRQSVVAAGLDSTYGRDISSQPRLIQHKNEAKAFYAFLSQVCKQIIWLQCWVHLRLIN